jgi:hypothetical protein
MKRKVFYTIAIRILILGIIGSLMSFLPEQLRGYFGDIPTTDPTPYGIDPAWDWGTRHYWYFWTMTILFILALVDLFITSISVISKEYPEI